MAERDRVGGPYLLVLAGAAVGVCLFMLPVPLWAGAGALGAVLLLGVVLRLLAGRPGDLAVRAPAIDALVLGGLGLALLLGAVLMAVR